MRSSADADAEASAATLAAAVDHLDPAFYDEYYNPGARSPMQLGHRH